MNLNIFSVFDSKAGAFVQPFFSQSVGTAVRDFESACNEEGSNFARYGGDYTLFHLGTFDQNIGKFEILETPANLGLAITFYHAPVIAGGE